LTWLPLNVYQTDKEDGKTPRGFKENHQVLERKTMKCLKRTALLVSLLCGGIMAPIFSAHATEYVVGVEDIYYRPYYYTERGEYRGIARDILDAFCREHNIVFKYEPLPVNRLYKHFLDGLLDFKFPDHPHWRADLKENHHILYSRPMLDFVDGTMVRPENLGQGLENINNLGTVLGFTPWAYLDRIKSGRINVTENGSFTGLLEQTIQGRVDGAYFNPVVARYQLEHVLKNPGALVFDPDLPHIESAYLLSTIKYPELLDKLDAFLARNPELVEQLNQKHDTSY
jgi:polar amino acid transport system substrate-binding protein